MRVLRAKLVRKSLKFYKLVFGIIAPYNVILDGNFIFAAIKYKIDVRDRLEKLLQGAEVKLYVMRSALKELAAVGTKAQSALDFASTYCETIEDDSFGGDVSSDRLTRLVESIHQDTTTTKKKRYFVATQDQELRRTLANTPGVPLLYLNKVSLVLEAPSNSSVNYNRGLEVSKTALSAEEASMVTSLSSKKKRKREGDEDVGDGDNSTAAGSDSNGTSTTEAKPKPLLTAASSSGTSRLTTALAPGVALVSRKKHRAHAPNPLSNAKASADSHNSKKKKERKYRKFY